MVEAYRASRFGVAASLAVCASLGPGCGGQDAKTTTIDSRILDAGVADGMDAARPRADSGGDRSDATQPEGDDSGPAPGPDAGNDTPDEATIDASDDSSSSDDSIGPQACGLTPCEPGVPCPDLTVDRADLLASIVVSERTFQPSDCAIAEGCIVASGTRKLLRFDTGTVNSGTADLAIGDPTMNACFMYSQCHGHYHFRGVGHYTLYQPDGVTVAAVGHKQGFCLEDVIPNPALNPPPANPAVLYSCTSQGLHIGWEDIYPNDIDCQWIDVTGVPPGNYVLSVVINAEHFLPESNYDNNEARVPVTLE